MLKIWKSGRGYVPLAPLTTTMLQWFNCFASPQPQMSQPTCGFRAWHWASRDTGSHWRHWSGSTRHEQFHMTVTLTHVHQAVPSKFDQGRSQTTEKHESRVIELSHGNNSAYFCRAPEAIDTLCTVRCLRGYSPPLTPWCRATCLARNGVAFSRWQHLACLQACIFRGVRPKPACYKQDS